MCGAESKMDPKQSLKRTARLLALQLFFSLLGTAMLLTHAAPQRRALGCDSACAGLLMSARSACALLAAMLMGYLSDRVDASRLLLVSSAGMAASALLGYAFADAFEGLWLAIPPLLVANSFTVAKSTVARQARRLGVGGEAVSAFATLGMGLGLAFTVGPAVGAKLLPGYAAGQLLSAGMQLVAAAVVMALPREAT
eukprot:CAMPEP_0198431884 /NCGR_PEP_ID=MMETSP1452-20131203/20863_1 /TAXON_ID=1181717 /ORGANISM="Synchroma pusillum, Strain CCMP3072" /LENGTH=196 /DNA_ID=CAMNT_0044152355 /DNA_START=19 /DNA_END=606 /DNA_ORIENTATION=+